MSTTIPLVDAEIVGDLLFSLPCTTWPSKV